MNFAEKSIDSFVAMRNESKILFTAGPASLLAANITGLRSCFGRGDDDYSGIETQVLERLRNMTGHSKIVRMQGSASLALEMMSLNFLYGSVLVIKTGFYSDRLKLFCEMAKRTIGEITNIFYVDWDELESFPVSVDWIFACYTDTSSGYVLELPALEKIAKKLKSKIMLDATASIGLEPYHELADVIGFSSCKGLFGLTGAGFICYNQSPANQVDSFYLSLETHEQKLMTGPYHSIASLYDVLPYHENYKCAVIENKNQFVRMMKKYLVYPKKNQPNLCTYVNCCISASDPRVILYQSRMKKTGSVVCHLGEVHLQRNAKGDILLLLEVK